MPYIYLPYALKSNNNGHLGACAISLDTVCGAWYNAP